MPQAAPHDNDDTATPHDTAAPQMITSEWRRYGLALAAGLVMLAGLVLIRYLMQGQVFSPPPQPVIVSGFFLVVNFCIAIALLLNLMRVSVWDMASHVLPIWFTLTVIAFLVLLITRAGYSIVFFAPGWIWGLLCLAGFASLARRLAPLTLGVVEGVSLPSLPDGIKRREVIVKAGKDAESYGHLDAVIAGEKQMQSPQHAAMLAKFAVRRIPVMPLHVFTETMTGRVDLAHLDGAVLIQLRPWRRYALLKRLSDIVMAGAGIILFAPVMLALYFLIPMQSPGPALFVQERIGAGGRVFRLYKFRSMIVADANDTASFAAKDDARITRIGRIIRTWRLDELPQLFNVLAGSMSMIGPRPEQEALAGSLAEALPLYHLRHVIRPGITGWAQVMQGYADDVATTDVKLSYDLFYIKNLSLMTDFAIFFKTLKIMITGFGSR